jgi:RNA polymerase sigma factor (sigma-70 family)
LLEEILKGCRKRRRSSQKELYRKFYAYGMSITLRYSTSENEAVTILNDAFMKVFDNIESFDSKQPFKPWFRKIILNTAINQYHKNSSRNHPLTSIQESTELGIAEMTTSEISYREIIRLIQKLPASYRTVFNLHVIEGFKHREIADILGISIGTSKSNLHKAKNILRNKLEKILTWSSYHVRSKS